jgi:hypothetical protein
MLLPQEVPRFLREKNNVCLRFCELLYGINSVAALYHSSLLTSTSDDEEEEPVENPMRFGDDGSESNEKEELGVAGDQFTLVLKSMMLFHEFLMFWEGSV